MIEAGADSEEMMRLKVARKRIAIAADALSNASDVKIPNIPKTEAVLRVLGMYCFLLDIDYLSDI